MNRAELHGAVYDLSHRLKCQWGKVRRIDPTTKGACIWYTHLRVEYCNLFQDHPGPATLETDELQTYAERLHALGCVMAVTDGILHSGGDWDDVLDLCETLYMRIAR